MHDIKDYHSSDRENISVTVAKMATRVIWQFSSVFASFSSMLSGFRQIVLVFLSDFNI